MEIEIALRKHDLPHEFSAAAKRQATRLPHEVQPGRPQGPRRPARAAAGHHRRRDRADFDDAVYCERSASGFPPDRRDRRRQPLRARRRRARSRSARARHVGVFSAPRDSDAARGAVQRALLAQARGRSAVHGLRHERSSAQGDDRGYRFYPAVMHSRARLTYTQVWDWLSQPEGGKSAEAKALLPHLRDICTRSTRCWPRRAHDVARSTSRRSSSSSSSTTHGKIEAIVPVAAQRGAQADRGMHAGGQRVRGRISARSRSIRRCIACTKGRRRKSSRR